MSKPQAGPASVGAAAHNATVETHDFVPRRPGRPPWTRELFIERYREALAATAPPQTNARVADNFRKLDGEVGADPDYLRKLKRRYRT